MLILRASLTELEPRYLYFVVRSSSFLSQVEVLRSGSAQPQLPVRDIRRVNIPLPPLPEQRRIAHILGTLDDKIELNRRMNETLEEMARAIFKDWFVDFGPVRAKMEGREAYLPEEIWRLFPDRLVESELGSVPEGWGVKVLDDFVEVSGGTTPSTKVAEYWDGGQHYWATPKRSFYFGFVSVIGHEPNDHRRGIGENRFGIESAGHSFTVVPSADWVPCDRRDSSCGESRVHCNATA